MASGHVHAHMLPVLLLDVVPSYVFGQAAVQLVICCTLAPPCISLQKQACVISQMHSMASGHVHAHTFSLLHLNVMPSHLFKQAAIQLVICSTLAPPGIGLQKQACVISQMHSMASGHVHAHTLSLLLLTVVPSYLLQRAGDSACHPAPPCIGLQKQACAVS